MVPEYLESPGGKVVCVVPFVGGSDPKLTGLGSTAHTDTPKPLTPVRRRSVGFKPELFFVLWLKFDDDSCLPLAYTDPSPSKNATT